jgi:uncharacterized protein YfaQ (DUF2300 family)
VWLTVALLVAAGLLQTSAFEAQLRAVFESCDDDGSGDIDVHEMMQVMAKLHQAVTLPEAQALMAVSALSFAWVAPKRFWRRFTDATPVVAKTYC